MRALKHNLAMPLVLGSLLMVAATPLAHAKRLREPHAPRGCSVAVGPISYDKNTETEVATIEGRLDYQGNNWLKEVLYWSAYVGATAAVGTELGSHKLDKTDTSVGAFFFGIVAIGLRRSYSDSFKCQPDSPEQQAKAERALKKACSKFIQNHYADDVYAVEDGIAQAHHYYCGEPYKIEVKSGERYMIKVFKADPIYKYGDFKKAKCEKLQFCYQMADTLEETEWVNAMKTDLGCEF
jgi:hypothetical protein